MRDTDCIPSSEGSDGGSDGDGDGGGDSDVGAGVDTSGAIDGSGLCSAFSVAGASRAMGACCCRRRALEPPDTPPGQRAVSRQIDKQLEQEKRRAQREIKMLLLGESILPVPFTGLLVLCRENRGTARVRVSCMRNWVQNKCYDQRGHGAKRGIQGVILLADQCRKVVNSELSVSCTSCCFHDHVNLRKSVLLLC